MNIFIELAKYAPRPISNPQENFFTNAFAYILNDNQKAAREFIKFLLRDKNISLPQIRKFWIDPQYRFDAGIVDLFVDANPIKIYIECKLQSRESKGKQSKHSQLWRYLKRAKNDGPKVYLAYITLQGDKLDDSISKDSQFLGHFLWSDIFEKLQHPLKNKLLGRQFIKYMEGIGMKKPLLNRKDIEMLPKAFICVAKFQAVRDELVKYISDEYRSRYIVKAEKRDHIGLKKWESWIGFNIASKKIGKRKEISFWVGFYVYANPEEKVENYFSIECKIPQKILAKKKNIPKSYYHDRDGEVYVSNDGYLAVSWGFSKQNLKNILPRNIASKQIKSLATRIDKAMRKLMRTKIYKHMIESK